MVEFGRIPTNKGNNRYDLDSWWYQVSGIDTPKLSFNVTSHEKREDAMRWGVNHVRYYASNL